MSHPLSTVRKARMLRMAGWSQEKTAQTLGISRGTVRRWENPEYHSRELARKARSTARRRYTAGASPSPEFLLERARVLYEAGMSYRAVAVLFAVDYGTDLTGDQVRFRVQAGRWNWPNGRGAPRTQKIELGRAA